MKLTQLITGTQILAASITAYADPIARDSMSAPFEIYGTGTLTCGAWAEARHSHNEAQTDLIHQWVTGWVASYNFYAPLSKSPTVETPHFDTISLWLDTYCQKNPTQKVAFATIALIDELGGPSAAHKRN